MLACHFMALVLLYTRTYARARTTTFNSLTDRIFYQFLHYHSTGKNFINRFTDKNCPLVKKTPMVLQTENTRKTIYPL